MAQDERAAVNWYRKAADQGTQYALCDLAKAYANGAGLETNHEEARKWYRRAAEQGHVPALVELAAFLEETATTAPQKAEAVCWYLQAAERGDGWALAKVAVCYELGYGIAKDATQAKQWRQRAVEKRGPEAEKLLPQLPFVTDPIGNPALPSSKKVPGVFVDLTEHRGKVVVLGFGARWSSAACKLGPQVEALEKRFQKQPFELLDVDIDGPDPLVRDWHVRFVPRVYVIDATGVVRSVGRDLNVEQVVESLLKEAKK